MVYRIKNAGTVLAETEYPFEYDSQNKFWHNSDRIVGDAKRAFKQFKLESVISPVNFKLRFTPLEQVAIAQLRKYDGAGEETPDEAKLQAAAVLNVLFAMIDDQRLNQIDLRSKSVIDGVAFCHSAGLISGDRIPEILADAEIAV